MKKFRVSWTEKHSRWIEAMTEDEAVHTCLVESGENSRDYQTVDEVKETENANQD